MRSGNVEDFAARAVHHSLFSTLSDIGGARASLVASQSSLTPKTAGRSNEISAPPLETEKFLHILQQQILQESPSKESVVIKRGDNLWNLVKGHLLAHGEKTDAQSILAGVRQVTQANNLANPDLLHVGKKLDFSVLKTASGGSLDGIEQSPGTVFHPHSFILPVNGTITSHFGLREDPFHGKLAFHKGMDIAASKGTLIKATADGVVTFSGWKKGYGNVVEIDHGRGVSSLYGHNEKNLVQVGEQVQKGVGIALVGATGRATGPHVHFEVRDSGNAVNPLAVVSRGTQVAEPITSQPERRFRAI